MASQYRRQTWITLNRMRRVLTIGVTVAAALALLTGAVDRPPEASAAPPTTEPVDGEVVVDGDEQVVDDEGVDATPVTLPLIPVPVGCEAPKMPHIVFIGTVVDRDFRTIRFEIEQIRNGRSAPFAADDLIDIRYGLDAQYLTDDERYLVSAVVNDDLGLLVSRTISYTI